MLNIDAKYCGLILVDMQNDFLHPQGAYGRNGQACDAIAALPPRLGKVADAMREAGGWIVSTHFTLVPGKRGEPFISPHLKKLRPFLGKGDFAPGSFGQALIDDLQPADLAVEKVAFSAFFQSRLEWLLNRAGLETLIFGGIVTATEGAALAVVVAIFISAVIYREFTLNTFYKACPDPGVQTAGVRLR